MDFFGGADGSRYDDLFHAAVGSGTESKASQSDVGKHKRPQLRIAAKVVGSHFSTAVSERVKDCIYSLSLPVE